MHQITAVTPLGEYKLDLQFDDGTRGIVDLNQHVGKGVFTAWNDPELFQSVAIGPSGELVWGNDIDLCPDALYLEVTGKPPEDVFPALNQQDAHA